MEPNKTEVQSSSFINIKHSQRTLPLQQITGKDYEKYEKLLGCELDIHSKESSRSSRNLFQLFVEVVVFSENKMEGGLDPDGP